jgi:hypothetical protein
MFRCAHYQSLASKSPRSFIGFEQGRLIADIDTYSELGHLHGTDAFRWRSGVKHDAARVMELTTNGNLFSYVEVPGAGHVPIPGNAMARVDFCRAQALP